MKMKYKMFNIIAISALISGGITSAAYTETFSEAFAKAKADGLAEFSYNGNLYSTQTAEEAANRSYVLSQLRLKAILALKPIRYLIVSHNF